MKVLFEVAPKIQDLDKFKFDWLNNENNWLFIIEDGKRMRTLGSNPDPGKELQTTTLNEARVCTSYSWNKDGSLLVLVVDRRQIYFCEIKTNNFTHYKPATKSIGTGGSTVKGSTKPKEIELVEWSKVSNKLVICYSSGQLLLSDCDANLSERFIDNSDGVLKKATSIESSKHLDIFVCITKIFEVLVMTFSGEAKFYIQSEEFHIVRAKFSPSFEETTLSNQTSLSKGETITKETYTWLSIQTNDDRISFKKIPLRTNSSVVSTTNADVIYKNETSDSQMVNSYWLSSTNLIACFSSGDIHMIQLKNLTGYEQIGLTRRQILRINQEQVFESDKSPVPEQEFKSFELNEQDGESDRSTVSSFSLAAISDHRLYYYDLIRTDEHQSSYEFEKVDDLDLSGSLSKLKLELKEVKWCADCSMLAVQLSNGHILVYRTRLQEYIVASQGSQVAYLSGSNEITVLNYGHESFANKSHEQVDSESVDTEMGVSENALTICVGLRPSVLAIGPEHLAVALNNRVQFYLIGSNSRKNQAEKLNNNLDFLIDTVEHASIVKDMSLCTSFVAVLFGDGRLKLHGISLSKADDELESGGVQDLNERFFPDPEKPEQISAFTLTEDYLFYGTKERCLSLFCLRNWSILQTCNHSNQFDRPIVKLKANKRGNKLVCLMSSYKDKDNVYLYDMYDNKMVKFDGSELYRKIYASQLITNSLEQSEALAKLPDGILPKAKKPRLSHIKDAIWDTDGRGLFLVEQKCIHIFVALDHTLEREGTVILHVATTYKPSSYTTLYASQGIVSYQTALGRVVNSVLETHDDELKLITLEQQILRLKANFQPSPKEEDKIQLLEAQTKMLALKLVYLNNIMPLYSLSKCKDICEHLMSDEIFNFDEQSRIIELDSIVWRQLAGWSLFTLNLNFALLIYRKHGLSAEARSLRLFVEDARDKRRLSDTRGSVKTRLLALLNCDDSSVA